MPVTRSYAQAPFSDNFLTSHGIPSKPFLIPGRQAETAAPCKAAGRANCEATREHWACRCPQDITGGETTAKVNVALRHVPLVFWHGADATYGFRLHAISLQPASFQCAGRSPPLHTITTIWAMCMGLALLVPPQKPFTNECDAIALIFSVFWCRTFPKTALSR